MIIYTNIHDLMLENLEHTKYDHLIPQLSKITTSLMLKGKSDAWLSIKFVKDGLKLEISSNTNEITIYLEDAVQHYRFESHIMIIHGTVEIDKIYELVKEKLNL